MPSQEVMDARNAHDRIKRKRTPPKHIGTDEGLLYQIESQIEDKEKEIHRMNGDIRYLNRRKKNLLRRMKVSPK